MKLLGGKLPNKGFSSSDVPPPSMPKQLHLALSSYAQDKGGLLICSLPGLPRAYDSKATGLSVALSSLLSVPLLILVPLHP